MLKKCKTCGIEKPLTDFHKLSQSKDGHNYSCKVCACKKARDWAKTSEEKYKQIKKKSDAKYQAKDYVKEKHRLRSIEYRKRNVEMIREKRAVWRKENSDKVKARQARYREEYKNTIKEGQSRYSKAHRPELNAKLWKYRAAKRQAIPKWSDLKSVAVIYAKCYRLSKWLEVKHHVDHIVPLQSDLVCGLHCEANLRIITQTENVVKGNRFWPDMW